MTTITIQINESDSEERNLIEQIRSLLAPRKAKIRVKEDSWRIPGIPHISDREACRAAVMEGMEDIRAGRVVTIEELRAKHPRL